MAVSPTTDGNIRLPEQNISILQDDSARMSDCLIAVVPRPDQMSVNHENPLCRLATRTVAGAGICGHGCGVCASSGPSHTCHMGLTMERVGSANWGGVQQWVGRRFLSVRAMHKALDQLSAAGYSEDEILSHLPPNPIVCEEDLRDAAHELIAREETEARYLGQERVTLSSAELNPPNVERQIEHPVQPSVLPPKQTESSSVRRSEELIGSKADQNVGNVLEYVAQVHSLLKTAVNRESVCERFLRALCAAVPFDEMSIFLQSKEANEPVIIAAVEKKKSVDVNLKQQSTRLDSQPLGLAAFKNKEALCESDGRQAPLDRDFAGSGRIAIPLLSSTAQCHGVWLASRSGRGEQGMIGSQWVRLVQLLGKLLSSRLEELEAQSKVNAASKSNSAPTAPVSAEITGHVSDGPWPVYRWQDELNRELARGARSSEPLALLHVCIEVPEGQEGLPVGQFTRALRRELRAYDQVSGLEGKANSWLILMPQIDSTGAQMTAGRLVSFFEDLLDAEGGMEERGLKIGIGIAAGSSGEGDPQQFMDRAAEASMAAVKMENGSPIKLLEFPQRAYGA